MPTEDETRPESPNAKRLAFPAFPTLPPGASDDELKLAMANAVMSIASNLQYLREVEETRIDQENVNARGLRDTGRRIVDLEQRVRKLEDKDRAR